MPDYFNSETDLKPLLRSAPTRFSEAPRSKTTMIFRAGQAGDGRANYTLPPQGHDPTNQRFIVRYMEPREGGPPMLTTKEFRSAASAEAFVSKAGPGATCHSYNTADGQETEVKFSSVKMAEPLTTSRMTQILAQIKEENGKLPKGDELVREIYRKWTGSTSWQIDPDAANQIKDELRGMGVRFNSSVGSSAMLPNGIRPAPKMAEEPALFRWVVSWNTDGLPSFQVHSNEQAARSYAQAIGRESGVTDVNVSREQKSANDVTGKPRTW